MDNALIRTSSSAIHGTGVFATEPIPRRTLIGTYEGRRYSPDEATPPEHDGVTYLFGLSDGATIDGGDGGNATRYINHSCKPNCVALEAYDEEDDLIVEIRAKRSIRSGEELSLDYALVVAEAAERSYSCSCGHDACRGTMVGDR